MSHQRIPELVKHARELMHKAVESTKREFSGIRSGKATTVAARPGPGRGLRQRRCRSIRSAWWRRPSRGCSRCSRSTSRLTQAIEKAIRDSDLGLNPASQGGLIRVPLPALNEERRKELVKVVHKLAEEGRVAVRHARTEAHAARSRRSSKIAEDDKTRAEKEIQKLTDEHIKQIDS